MTRTEILDDGRRHALDPWIAEHVLGWRWMLEPRSGHKKRFLAPPGDYIFAKPATGGEPVDRDIDRSRARWTEDMSHAWEVVEAVRKWPADARQRFVIAVAFQSPPGTTMADATAWLLFGAENAPLVICRAALLAVLDRR